MSSQSENPLPPPAMQQSPATLQPPAADVHRAVAQALAEDIGPLGDLTSALLPQASSTTAQIASRSDGVLAGTACAAETFRQVDSDITVKWQVSDGDRLAAGQTIADVSGRLSSVCTAERVALNFLSHLSGVATHTRRFVGEAEGKVAIFDTRKTTPGLRSLEKAAVRAGGGFSHRFSLSEWVMLKDNHLSEVEISDAVNLARQRWPARRVQVECDSVEQAIQAIDSGADALLLDHMKPEDVRQVTEHMQQGGLACYLEASGGITLKNITLYLDLKLDAISSGSLIGGAQALDIGLDIVPLSLRTETF